MTNYSTSVHAARTGSEWPRSSRASCSLKTRVAGRRNHPIERRSLGLQLVKSLQLLWCHWPRLHLPRRHVGWWERGLTGGGHIRSILVARTTPWARSIVAPPVYNRTETEALKP